MFTSNPFAELSASIPPAVMQAYVVVMIVLVAAGTLFDVVHKGSAKYFFENWRKSKGKGAKPVGGGELVSIAVKTAVVDVLDLRRVLQPAAPHRPPADDVRIRDLRRHHRHHGVRLPDARDARARPSCRCCGGSAA